MYPQVWPTTGRLSPRTFIFWSCFSEGISFVLLSVFNVESSFGFSENLKYYKNGKYIYRCSCLLLHHMDCCFYRHNDCVFKFSHSQSYSALDFHYEHYPSSTRLHADSRQKWCDHLVSLIFHFLPEYFAFCIIEYIMVDENGWFWYLNLRKLQLSTADSESRLFEGRIMMKEGSVTD